MSLFIGNLSNSISVPELEKMCNKYGSCKVNYKGTYAFAEYDSEKDADEAIQNLKGQSLNGREMNIEWSKKSTKFEGSRRKRSSSFKGRCYNCGHHGHYARDCPRHSRYHSRSRSRSSRRSRSRRGSSSSRRHNRRKGSEDSRKRKSKRYRKDSSSRSSSSSANDRRKRRHRKRSKSSRSSSSYSSKKSGKRSDNGKKSDNQKKSVSRNEEDHK